MLSLTSYNQLILFIALVLLSLCLHRELSTSSIKRRLSIDTSITRKSKIATKHKNNLRRSSIIKSSHVKEQKIQIRGAILQNYNIDSDNDKNSDRKIGEFTAMNLGDNTPILTCFNQTKCIQPVLQLKQHFKVYLW